MSEEDQTTLEAVRGTFLSRFNSPFLGAFLVSWLVWNHRLILVLVSGMDVDKRFNYIDQTLYPTATYSLWMNLGGPLVSTLVYIFLLPWVTEWVHEWNLSRAKKLSEATRRSKGEELLGREESERYRVDRERRLEQIDNLNKKVEQANIELAGWRAVAAVRLDSKDPAAAIIGFLTSQKFTFTDGGQPFSSVRVKISFGPMGNVFLSGRSELDDVERWEVRRNQLVLSGKDGAEMAVFTMTPESARFVAESGEFEIDADDFKIATS
ncbi:hypothetical protein D3C81_955970 [compost metagenome]